MPAAREQHSAAVIGGVLYVVGGYDRDLDSLTATLFAYRPK